MTNLHAILEARLAFDERAAFNGDLENKDRFFDGAKWQSDRLKPIHDALIECAVRIEEVIQDSYGNQHDKAALANLEKLLREGTDE